MLQSDLKGIEMRAKCYSEGPYRLGCGSHTLEHLLNLTSLVPTPNLRIDVRCYAGITGGCTFRSLATGTVSTTTFFRSLATGTVSFDTLYIGGTYTSGTTGPSGVSVTSGEQMTWDVDSSTPKR